MHGILSQNNRILVLIALLAMASLSVGGIVYVVSADQATELGARSTRIERLDALAHDIEIKVNHAEGALSDFVFSGEDGARQRVLVAIADQAAAVGRFRALAAGMAPTQAALTVLETSSLEWKDQIATPTIRGIQAGDPTAVDLFRAQTFEEHTAVDGAIDSLQRELDRGRADIEADRVETARAQVVGVALSFGVMMLAFAVAMIAVRRFGRALERDARDASVLNRFTELTSFADEDRQVAEANLIALGRLAGPDASVTHILNRSMDRAVPEASTGDAIATILPLHELSRCAGIQRGTMYVTDDLADELSVRCPIYPMASGTLACVPLISGESVGAVHLYWAQPRGLPLERRSGIARITEHAALAIGNRRLLAALHGQANTDARTGLPNSRAFDLMLESALHSKADDGVLSVLMIDIDHFKAFNDRQGHPAGDEALRAFANTLRSCMREADAAARYGGEEFAVYLPGIDHASGLAIAERIRARTEATIISLAPGITDRVTISIGVASAPDHGQDRATLLRLADQALYIAKSNGRNRVESVSDTSGSWASDPRPGEATVASLD